MQWIFQEFRISIDETTVGRELKALGSPSCRTAHAASRTTSRRPLLKRLRLRSGRNQSQALAGHGHRTADEARIGQKNKFTRRWARRGTRRSALRTSEPCGPTSSGYDLTLMLSAEAGLHPRISQVADEKQTIVSMFGAGIGLARVPRWTSTLAPSGVRF